MERENNRENKPNQNLVLWKDEQNLKTSSKTCKEKENTHYQHKDERGEINIDFIHSKMGGEGKGILWTKWYI